MKETACVYALIVVAFSAGCDSMDRGTRQTPISSSFVSKVWVADDGDGTYNNPILHTDYFDPDVVGVGDDFYMAVSSFNAIPGMPILHSKNLINWQIFNHAWPQLPDEV